MILRVTVFVLGILVSAAVLSDGVSTALSSDTAVDTADIDEWEGLPPGDGREEVYGLCSACHSLRIVQQQGLSHDSWKETLDWMVDEQGMPELDPSMEAKVIDYLTLHYGVDRKL